MTINKDKNERVFVHDNRFYINGTFDDEMRNAVVWQLTEQINKLKDKKNSEIELYISSHGGDGWLLFDLVDLIERAKRLEIKVKTIVTSHALSCGSLLAVTGTVGERYIARSAEHLVHYGQFDGWRKTTPLQLDRNYQHNKRWNALIFEHYQKYCDIPKLDEHLKDDDFWIPATKCIKWKLADKYTDEL